MKAFAQHLADCRSLLVSRQISSVAVSQSVGLTLAQDILAPADSPAFATSAMDGYAVRVADVPGVLTMVGDVPAGVVPTAEVRLGAAVRVMTGSALPVGTEAVVPVEDTYVERDTVTVRTGTTSGRHLRSAGDDVRAGDIVLQAGQVIGPGQLAALLANAADHVRVQLPSRVVVLSTGDELVDAGQEVGPAKIVDTNGPALAAAATAAGANVVHVGRLSDDPANLVAALDALPDCDLVISSGGVSMGAYDVVKTALAPLGIRFEPVAMQPGKPQGWGRLRSGPAFLGLPGNPVSALICFELFGRAVLGRERLTLKAELGNPIRRRPSEKRQFLRGRMSGTTVSVEGGPGSHLVVGYARADCLVVVPEHVEMLPAGAVVDVIPLR